MNTRPAFSPRGWLLLAATSLLLIGPAILSAQTRGGSSARGAASNARYVRSTEPLSLRPLTAPIINVFQHELDKVKAESKLRPEIAAAERDNRESTPSAADHKPEKRIPGLLPFFRPSRAAASPNRKSRESTVKPANRQFQPAQTASSHRVTSSSQSSRTRGLPIEDPRKNRYVQENINHLKKFLLSNRLKSPTMTEEKTLKTNSSTNSLKISQGESRKLSRRKPQKVSPRRTQTVSQNLLQKESQKVLPKDKSLQENINHLKELLLSNRLKSQATTEEKTPQKDSSTHSLQISQRESRKLSQQEPQKVLPEDTQNVVPQVSQKTAATFKRPTSPVRSASPARSASSAPSASPKPKTHDAEVQLTASRGTTRPDVQKRSLLDVLFGKSKRPTTTRRRRESSIVPPAPKPARSAAPKQQPSAAIERTPGLLPSFLRLKPKTARSSHLGSARQTATTNSATARVTTAPTTMPRIHPKPSLPPAAETAATVSATAVTTPTAQQAPVRINTAATSRTDLRELRDPFPEVSEAEADRQEQNPFTGMKLNAEPEFRQPSAVRSISEEQTTEPQDPPESLAAPEREPLAGELPVDETPLAGGTPPFPAEAEFEQPVIVAPERPNDDKPLTLEEKMKRLSERSGLDGLKGFCPVVLRDRRGLVDADPRISSTFDQQTYHLSSFSAKSRFDAEPAKYAPAHNGNDVIVLTQGHVELPGSLENAVWFKDRLYLFSSSATLELFVQDPAKYAAAAEE